MLYLIKTFFIIKNHFIALKFLKYIENVIENQSFYFGMLKKMATVKKQQITAAIITIFVIKKLGRTQKI